MNSKVILWLNAGSPSLKFALYQIADGNETPLARGAVEHDGQTCRLWVYTAEQKIDKTDKVAFTLSAALHPAVTELEQLKLPPLDAVGDRVVQGGPNHATPVRMTASVNTGVKVHQHTGVKMHQWKVRWCGRLAF